MKSSSPFARHFILGNSDDPNILGGYPMTVETSASCVKDLAARQHYPAAFARNSFATC